MENETKDKTKQRPTGYYKKRGAALGVAFGIAIGLALSSSVGGIGNGIAIGLAIGLAGGAGIGASKDTKAKKEGNISEETEEK
ncbi:hypothetical protein COB18_01910 [Candidatus Kaiserbacteria bacterium]|nr:MAG: hypothetical protein COB18_01910 [Candidatus Kaiserbacteria bacterium]